MKKKSPTVNGWTRVELAMNMGAPCAVCGLKEKVMWTKGTEIRCFVHITREEG